jgi:hypothetical protein
VPITNYIIGDKETIMFRLQGKLGTIALALLLLAAAGLTAQAYAQGEKGTTILAQEATPIVVTVIVATAVPPEPTPAPLQPAPPPASNSFLVALALILVIVLLSIGVLVIWFRGARPGL